MRRLYAALLVTLLSAGSARALADEANWEQPRLPAVAWGRNTYPPEAMRDTRQGRVLVAFDITPTGATRNVSILWAEDDVFREPALRMVANARFKVPDDWSATGARRRWRVGVVYRLDVPMLSQLQSDRFAVPVEKIDVTGVLPLNVTFGGAARN
jgi:TonB family protein